MSPKVVLLDPPEKVKVCVKCWAPGEPSAASPCSHCGATAHYLLDKPEDRL
jgi:hypothetical protein